MGTRGAEQFALISVIADVALVFTLLIPLNAIFAFGEEFGCTVIFCRDCHPWEE